MACSRTSPLARILWEDFEEHKDRRMELVWREQVGRWLPQDLEHLYPEPLEWATQANKLAKFLQEKLASYQEAEPLYREALAIWQKGQKPGSFNAADEGSLPPASVGSAPASAT
jgi:hypothetical protein